MFIVFSNLREGKMKRILLSDWLLERAKYPALVPQEKVLFLAFLLTETKSRNEVNIQRNPYPAVLTSRLVNNALCLARASKKKSCEILFYLTSSVSLCFESYCWFAFVLWFGNFWVSFQSLFMHHLVIAQVRNTKKRHLKKMSKTLSNVVINL